LSKLPVIVGFGGVNAAGRSSGFVAFRRLVMDMIGDDKGEQTYISLASMMGLIQYESGQWVTPDKTPIDPTKVRQQFGAAIEAGTLLRKLEGNHFDGDKAPYHKQMKVPAGVTFEMAGKDLPNQRPLSWDVKDLGGGKVSVTTTEPWKVLQPDTRKLLAQTGGQLPTGFDLSSCYPSNHHPRGLMMSLYGASDAVGNSGFDVEELKKHLRPDQISVYSASAMGQLDDLGLGGYMKSACLGKRTSTKQMPFSLAEMPADFINAYVLGSVGRTGGILGACASLLYNLDAAAADISSGKSRVALVGMAEAPLVPEVYEGYRVMSALAEDGQILDLDRAAGRTTTDYSRACRPFGNNCGFTLAESAQYFLLMDDDLAVELGAKIYGSLGGVFVAADGIKKSISAPGVGNYLSIAKAAALTRSIIGEKGLRNHSYVHAHGTGTPQNRVTESHGLNEVAKAFGVDSWPVVAAKCYWGHSIGTAAGDQIMTALGSWEDGVLPGIFTLDQVAQDVHQSNLAFSQGHQEIDKNHFQASLINSKGFGGNNATGVLLSPSVTTDMLTKKHGAQAMKAHQEKSEAVSGNIEAYHLAAQRGEAKTIYRFGEPVPSGDDLVWGKDSLNLPGFEQPVDLNLKNPFEDMTS